MWGGTGHPIARYSCIGGHGYFLGAARSVASIPLVSRSPCVERLAHHEVFLSAPTPDVVRRGVPEECSGVCLFNCLRL